MSCSRFPAWSLLQHHCGSMQTTPLWVPTIVAGVGELGTIGAGIGGILMTQRRSDRREDVNWAREQERELECWIREDELRTFEHRRESYANFYEALKGMARTGLRPRLRIPAGNARGPVGGSEFIAL